MVHNFKATKVRKVFIEDSVISSSVMEILKSYRGMERNKVTKMEISAEQLKKLGLWNKVDQA